MATLKKIFGYAFRNPSIISRNQFDTIKHNGTLFQNAFINSQIRCISFYPVAQNMQFVSNNPNLKIKLDAKTMKMDRPLEKPLCYMFTWLNAKNNHISKYANIYLDKGFEIFNITCTPVQVMWPAWGSQIVAKKLLNFMEQNNHMFDPIVLQGYSIGSYMWGEVCKIASKDLARYQPVMDQIICQIWDSVGDFASFGTGMAEGQFPDKPALRNFLLAYTKLHLKVFYYTSTQHYINASHYMHNNLVRAPALFLVSKTDPVVGVAPSWNFKASWEKLGTKVTWKDWEKSPHVKILQTHPKEYLETVDKHLKENVPMLKDI